MRNRRGVVLAGIMMLMSGSFILDAVGTDTDVTKLPDKVVAAIRAEFPKAVIKKAASEKENGTKVFEVEFTADGRKHEATVSVEGQIIEVESEVALKDLPAAEVTAITKAANGEKVVRVQKEETRAEVKGGKIVALPAPKIEYEAKLADGKKVEIHGDADEDNDE